MAQIKMKYGIDLGTTNSAICKMENGEPSVRKTDTLKDTLPSCVSFTKKKVVKVGDSAYNDLRQDRSRATKVWTKGKENVFVEFKRTMGLETEYYSSNMERGYNSEELSAEVLKTLKSFIDENISSAVITIPAKFKTDQIAATKRAANMAGFEHCELLQEPIAAAMAYGLNSTNKNCYWVVFDFGGGTFDAAVLKVEDGIISVLDTEGDNYLGGKDLDYAIVDNIIVPYLKKNFVIDNIMANDSKRQILRDAMKFYAEQAKNQLSFKEKCDITSQLDEFGEDDEGSEIELDMVISQSELEPVLSPIFQKAIDCCKGLLERNNLLGKIDSLILVGGPTYSPVLRKMLKEQITPNVDTSIDPMTAVAKGAALYASTIETEEKAKGEAGTIALNVEYESTSVESIEYVVVKLLSSECKGSLPSKLFVELTRGDKAWSSGKIPISSKGDVIECQLREGRANSFTIVAYDDKGTTYPCFPNEITIIQGTKVGSAVLPYHIGIEVEDVEKNKDVFIPLKGLEKNQPLPAVGVRNGLKCHKIQPGVVSNNNRLVIPIYQVEHNAEGSSAVYNDHVFDVEITGDDVSAFIPEDSDVDITIKVDNSQMMVFEVTFPVIGETIEKTVDVKRREGVTVHDLQDRMREAKDKIRVIGSSTSVAKGELDEAQAILNDVQNRFEGEKNTEDGKMHLLADIRRAFLSMEAVEKNHEWDIVESELKEQYDRLEKADKDLGNDRSHAMLSELHRQTDEAIRKRDVAIGRSVLKDMRDMYIGLTYIYQLMGFLRHVSSDFNSIGWSNPTRARQLLERGQSMVAAGNPDVEALRQICVELIELMPQSQKVRL